MMIHLEWGAEGVARYSERVNVCIIVDVLSFCTSLDAALSVGATVIPFAWNDQRAAAAAVEAGAILARQRGDVGSDGKTPTLSPDSLLKLRPGQVLLLPSPNGATLSTLSKAPHTLAGCLRNARAVAEKANELGGDIVVIAAGERWPDDSLRVALEDQVGAGALIHHLTADKSLEAMAAETLFLNLTDIPSALHTSTSGQELANRGFAQDVSFASQVNISGTVPILTSGRFDNGGCG